MSQCLTKELYLYRQQSEEALQPERQNDPSRQEVQVWETLPVPVQEGHRPEVGMQEFRQETLQGQKMPQEAKERKTVAKLRSLG